MKRNTGTVQTLLATLLLAALLAGCNNSAPAAAATAAPAQATTAPQMAATTAAAPAAENDADADQDAAMASDAMADTMTDTTSAAMPAEMPTTKLDLNTATNEQLLGVPGVNDRMLREFKEYRPYVSIQQFRKELGKYIDDTQIAAYEQYVYVPVDINESDAATLQQIPGVTEQIATDLIAGRPYADQPAFLDALKAQVADADLTVVTNYLAAK